MIPIKDDNPRIKPPIVTIGLIVINVVVFLYELSQPNFDRFIMQYGAVPSQIMHGKQVETILTSMFLHGSTLHLVGNMLYLWIFGDNVEGYLGHARYLSFYLVCGLIATFSYILVEVLITPAAANVLDVPMVGASGAISGVLGAYILKYPRARVLVVIPIFFFLDIRRIPALFVLGFWFLMQFLSWVFSAAIVGGREAGGGIAFWAHIGGFLAGLLLVNLFKGRRKRHWDFVIMR